jgi:hypothetical protein
MPEMSFDLLIKIGVAKAEWVAFLAKTIERDARIQARTDVAAMRAHKVAVRRNPKKTPAGKKPSRRPPGQS